jgi:predicted GNAT family acetyltransferase
MTVRDNPAELRYELLDGEAVVGEIRYRRRPGAVVLVHTEVDPAHEGQGLASLLVAEALRDLHARGLRVIPVCPYVRAWLHRHPEQADLLVPDRESTSSAEDPPEDTTRVRR